ncbi:MAG TPA: hypothetical protein PKB15_01540 [Acidimicrobiia bacterium]|nr:hypothetical protein [Acidimicrobiia bacterium]
MTGLECVAVIDVDGIEARVVGHYSDDTPSGMFDCFDIYVRNERSNIFELIDLGQPFEQCPVDEEVGTIIHELFNPNAVRIVANA